MERRTRPRPSAEHAPALGAANLNPFGDLHAIQHLSARFARGLRGVFEPILGRAIRGWAEPLSVQRWADYRAERGKGLAAWVPLAMEGQNGRATLVLDGAFVLELLDRFFGGEGDVPQPLPEEFTAAADALLARLGEALAPMLGHAWEPVARLVFRSATPESYAVAPALNGDAAVVVTRFGLGGDHVQPVFFDLVYPVAALKPHGAQIATKVHGIAESVEPRWRTGLTRAVMTVKLPVRSVLAEPSMSFGELLALKAGDVIPIDIAPEVPVMVAKKRLGTGLVGTANGRAAVRLTQIEPISEEDFR